MELTKNLIRVAHLVNARGDIEIRGNKIDVDCGDVVIREGSEFIQIFYSDDKNKPTKRNKYITLDGFKSKLIWGDLLFD